MKNAEIKRLTTEIVTIKRYNSNNVRAPHILVFGLKMQKLQVNLSSNPNSNLLL